ncbi:hydrolase [Bacillus songklensis]|uniref:Hydrolase n=1 Tax=Bacillus songklensis TaxID=1069116 RepID=A0ABV8B682_9BACI
MDNQKKTYYITVGTGEISQLKSVSEWNYKIEATDEEITKLREYFDQNYSSDWQGFFRAHVPYLQYHYDRQNDGYDETMIRIYDMLYKLGDDETKDHIAQMGILSRNQPNE